MIEVRSDESMHSGEQLITRQLRDFAGPLARLLQDNGYQVQNLVVAVLATKDGDDHMLLHNSTDLGKLGRVTAALQDLCEAVQAQEGPTEGERIQ